MRVEWPKEMTLQVVLLQIFIGSLLILRAAQGKGVLYIKLNEFYNPLGRTYQGYCCDIGYVDADGVCIDQCDYVMRLIVSGLGRANDHVFLFHRPLKYNSNNIVFKQNDSSLVLTVLFDKWPQNARVKMNAFFYDYDDYDHTTTLVDWFETDLMAREESVTKKTGRHARGSFQSQTVSGNRKREKTKLTLQWSAICDEGSECFQSASLADDLILYKNFPFFEKFGEMNGLESNFKYKIPKPMRKNLKLNKSGRRKLDYSDQAGTGRAKAPDDMKSRQQQLLKEKKTMLMAKQRKLLDRYRTRKSRTYRTDQRYYGRKKGFSSKSIREQNGGGPAMGFKDEKTTPREKMWYMREDALTTQGKEFLDGSSSLWSNHDGKDVEYTNPTFDAISSTETNNRMGFSEHEHNIDFQDEQRDGLANPTLAHGGDGLMISPDNLHLATPHDGYQWENDHSLDRNFVDSIKSTSFVAPRRVGYLNENMDTESATSISPVGDNEGTFEMEKKRQRLNSPASSRRNAPFTIPSNMNVKSKMDATAHHFHMDRSRRHHGDVNSESYMSRQDLKLTRGRGNLVDPKNNADVSSHIESGTASNFISHDTFSVDEESFDDTLAGATSLTKNEMFDSAKETSNPENVEERGTTFHIVRVEPTKGNPKSVSAASKIYEQTLVFDKTHHRPNRKRVLRTRFDKRKGKLAYDSRGIGQNHYFSNPSTDMKKDATYAHNIITQSPRDAIQTSGQREINSRVTFFTVPYETRQPDLSPRQSIAANDKNPRQVTKSIPVHTQRNAGHEGPANKFGQNGKSPNIVAQTYIADLINGESSYAIGLPTTHRPTRIINSKDDNHVTGTKVILNDGHIKGSVLSTPSRAHIHDRYASNNQRAPLKTRSKGDSINNVTLPPSRREDDVKLTQNERKQSASEPKSQDVTFTSDETENLDVSPQNAVTGDTISSRGPPLTKGSVMADNDHKADSGVVTDSGRFRGRTVPGTLESGQTWESADPWAKESWTTPTRKDGEMHITKEHTVIRSTTEHPEKLQDDLQETPRHAFHGQSSEMHDSSSLPSGKTASYSWAQVSNLPLFTEEVETHSSTERSRTSTDVFEEPRETQSQRGTTTKGAHRSQRQHSNDQSDVTPPVTVSKATFKPTTNEFVTFHPKSNSPRQSGNSTRGFGTEKKPERSSFAIRKEYTIDITLKPLKTANHRDGTNGNTQPNHTRQGTTLNRRPIKKVAYYQRPRGPSNSKLLYNSIKKLKAIKFQTAAPVHWFVTEHPAFSKKHKGRRRNRMHGWKQRPTESLFDDGFDTDDPTPDGLSESNGNIDNDVKMVPLSHGVSESNGNIDNDGQIVSLSHGVSESNGNIDNDGQMVPLSHGEKVTRLTDRRHRHGEKTDVLSHHPRFFTTAATITYHKENHNQRLRHGKFPQAARDRPKETGSPSHNSIGKISQDKKWKTNSRDRDLGDTNPEDTRRRVAVSPYHNSIGTLAEDKLKDSDSLYRKSDGILTQRQLGNRLSPYDKSIEQLTQNQGEVTEDTYSQYYNFIGTTARDKNKNKNYPYHISMETTSNDRKGDKHSPHRGLTEATTRQQTKDTDSLYRSSIGTDTQVRNKDKAYPYRASTETTTGDKNKDRDSLHHNSIEPITQDGKKDRDYPYDNYIETITQDMDKDRDYPYDNTIETITQDSDKDRDYPYNNYVETITQDRDKERDYPHDNNVETITQGMDRDRDSPYDNKVERITQDRDKDRDYPYDNNVERITQDRDKDRDSPYDNKVERITQDRDKDRDYPYDNNVERITQDRDKDRDYPYDNNVETITQDRDKDRDSPYDNNVETITQDKGKNRDYPYDNNVERITQDRDKDRDYPYNNNVETITQDRDKDRHYPYDNYVETITWDQNNNADFLSKNSIQTITQNSGKNRKYPVDNFIQAVTHDTSVAYNSPYRKSIDTNTHDRGKDRDFSDDDSFETITQDKQTGKYPPHENTLSSIIFGKHKDADSGFHDTIGKMNEHTLKEYDNVAFQRTDLPSRPKIDSSRPDSGQRKPPSTSSSAFTPGPKDRQTNGHGDEMTPDEYYFLRNPIFGLLYRKVSKDTSRGYTSRGYTSRGYTSRGYTSRGYTSRGYTSRGYTSRGSQYDTANTTPNKPSFQQSTKNPYRFVDNSESNKDISKFWETFSSPTRMEKSTPDHNRDGNKGRLTPKQTVDFFSGIGNLYGRTTETRAEIQKQNIKNGQSVWERITNLQLNGRAKQKASKRREFQNILDHAVDNKAGLRKNFITQGILERTGYSMGGAHSQTTIIPGSITHVRRKERPQWHTYISQLKKMTDSTRTNGQANTFLMNTNYPSKWRDFLTTSNKPWEFVHNSIEDMDRDHSDTPGYHPRPLTDFNQVHEHGRKMNDNVRKLNPTRGSKELENQVGKMRASQNMGPNSVRIQTTRDTSLKSDLNTDSSTSTVNLNHAEKSPDRRKTSFYHTETPSGKPAYLVTVKQLQHKNFGEEENDIGHHMVTHKEQQPTFKTNPEFTPKTSESSIVHIPVPFMSSTFYLRDSIMSPNPRSETETQDFAKETIDSTQGTDSSSTFSPISINHVKEELASMGKPHPFEGEVDQSKDAPVRSNNKPIQDFARYTAKTSPILEKSKDATSSQHHREDVTDATEEARVNKDSQNQIEMGEWANKGMSDHTNVNLIFNASKRKGMSDHTNVNLIFNASKTAKPPRIQYRNVIQNTAKQSGFSKTAANIDAFFPFKLTSESNLDFAKVDYLTSTRPPDYHHRQTTEGQGQYFVYDADQTTRHSSPVDTFLEMQSVRQIDDLENMKKTTGRHFPFLNNSKTITQDNVFQSKRMPTSLPTSKIPQDTKRARMSNDVQFFTPVTVQPRELTTVAEETSTHGGHISSSYESFRNEENHRHTLDGSWVINSMDPELVEETYEGTDENPSTTPSYSGKEDRGSNGATAKNTKYPTSKVYTDNISGTTTTTPSTTTATSTSMNTKSNQYQSTVDTYPKQMSKSFHDPLEFYSLSPSKTESQSITTRTSPMSYILSTIDEQIEKRDQAEDSFPSLDPYRASTDDIMNKDFEPSNASNDDESGDGGESTKFFRRQTSAADLNSPLEHVIDSTESDDSNNRDMFDVTTLSHNPETHTASHATSTTQTPDTATFSDKAVSSGRTKLASTTGSRLMEDDGDVLNTEVSADPNSENSFLSQLGSSYPSSSGRTEHGSTTGSRLMEDRDDGDVLNTEVSADPNSENSFLSQFDSSYPSSSGRTEHGSTTGSHPMEDRDDGYVLTTEVSADPNSENSFLSQLGSSYPSETTTMTTTEDSFLSLTTGAVLHLLGSSYPTETHGITTTVDNSLSSTTDRNLDPVGIEEFSFMKQLGTRDDSLFEVEDHLPKDGNSGNRTDEARENKAPFIMVPYLGLKEPPVKSVSHKPLFPVIHIKIPHEMKSLPEKGFILQTLRQDKNSQQVTIHPPNPNFVKPVEVKHTMTSRLRDIDLDKFRRFVFNIRHGPKLDVPMQALYHVPLNSTNTTDVNITDTALELPLPGRQQITPRVDFMNMKTMFTRYWPAVLGVTIGTIFLLAALVTSLWCKQHRLLIQRTRWIDSPQHLNEPPDTSEYATSSASSLTSDVARSSANLV